MLGRPRPDSPALQAISLLVAALIALGVVGPAGASAATGGESPLSSDLEALATPEVAAQPVPAQAEAVGLPAEGPGSLSREGTRVVVEARVEGDASAQVEDLEAAGAEVLVASRRYGTVALSVEPEDLEALAAVPGVTSVAPVLRPVVYGAGEGPITDAAPSNGLCEGGSVISQGVAQLNVPAARAAFGARGAGQTVGVISDSFNSATTGIDGGPLATRAEGDEVSNDLPGGSSTCSGQQVPVNVIAEAPISPTAENTDEGRAMLQVVHDVAPHANLAFATAEGGELVFARNIERLAEPVAAGGAGATVIVDDIGYLSEPFYQDGPVAVAIQKVTERGVTYLSAAGNENVRDGAGRNIGSWEALKYRPGACPVTNIIGLTPNACMNFNPSGSNHPKFGIEVAAEGEVSIDLQWAEPWFGVTTDLNAYLVNKNNEVLSEYKEEEGTINSTVFGKPIELLDWKNETNPPQATAVYLVINRRSGVGTPRLKFEFVGHGDDVTETEYPSSVGGDVVGPTIYGHAGSAAAISVGAIRYTESATTPKEPEFYSSRGPVTHLFGPVLGSAPASPIAEQVIPKPDLTATDCASTTFFARLVSGAWRFCGTSEAAPHAAAVAALMKQSAPFASPAAIREAMQASATKYSPPSTANAPEAVGAGLLNAAGALTALGGAAVDDPPSTVVPPLGEQPPPGPPPAPPAPPAPTVELTKKPGPLTAEGRPTFEFRANQPVTFACQLDGGAAQPCASPYVLPAALGNGAHGFTVIGTDSRGRSGSSGVYDFTVDTKAPKTTFAMKPKSLLRTKKKSAVARFRLRASESPVTFYCQVDEAPLRICAASFHRRFGKGMHVVKVKAKDAAGNLAKAWTAVHFRVKLVRPGHPPHHRSHRSA